MKNDEYPISILNEIERSKFDLSFSLPTDDSSMNIIHKDSHKMNNAEFQSTTKQFNSCNSDNEELWVFGKPISNELQQKYSEKQELDVRCNFKSKNSISSTDKFQNFVHQNKVEKNKDNHVLTENLLKTCNSNLKNSINDNLDFDEETSHILDVETLKRLPKLL